MFFAGLDFGQKRDHTAIVVVERVRRIVRPDDLSPTCNQRQGRCSLTVDATGVGAPVVDMLNAAPY